MRVVRFYQSALPPRPPPRPRHPPPPPRLLLQFLLDHVCINFHLHFRLANSSPSALPTLFADSLRQALCQLPSSVCTAGPQPGTCPAQCVCPAQSAPLDLNLQLSVHRWTSTWGLPSSVCTAGPQPGTCPAQCAPLDLNGQIECQKRCQIECQIECQKICQIKCHEICQIKCHKICQIECQIE